MNHTVHLGLPCWLTESQRRTPYAHINALARASELQCRSDKFIHAPSTAPVLEQPIEHIVPALRGLDTVSHLEWYYNWSVSKQRRVVELGSVWREEVWKRRMWWSVLIWAASSDPTLWDRETPQKLSLRTGMNVFLLKKALGVLHMDSGFWSIPVMNYQCRHYTRVSENLDNPSPVLERPGSAALCCV